MMSMACDGVDLTIQTRIYDEDGGSMFLENKIMLSTYADSLGANLNELQFVLEQYFKEQIGSVHLLPFFPSSADRGFAPLTYQEVDPRFGAWEDLDKIATNFGLMYDFMINHISKSSLYFKDFLENKEKSRYNDLFIRYSDFWPGGGPTEQQLKQIYTRKPRPPFQEVEFAGHTWEKVWCTFDNEQIDLDVTSETTQRFIRENLVHLAQKKAAMIRLDAFAYTTKKAGTNCFFVEPDIWTILEYCRDCLAEFGVEVLPEIHEHYTIQLKLAEKGYWVYDFALPMLLLYSIYSGNSERLIHWLKICPRKQFTTLDTHDGIGVVDVIGLLNEEEIEITKTHLYTSGANVKKIYNTPEYHNLDIYQLNCTYYSALHNDDAAYLLARAIQFFAPGIPQIYYVGLLAGANDIQLVNHTKVGRDINRHYYTREEIDREVQRPVLKKMYQLMKFRNLYPAFSGDVTVLTPADSHSVRIKWVKDGLFAQLDADLQQKTFNITYLDQATGSVARLSLEREDIFYV
jgi:sucrose phosphorylase